ncbi:hypothetical protein JCM1840_000963 [Sporobolomyces johnsonii]
MRPSPEPQLETRPSRPPEPDAGTSSSSETEDADEAEEEYVVEEIRASRWDSVDNCWRYFIKWKGYSEEEKTWEPASNLNCPELLAEFEERKRRREQSRISREASAVSASTSQARKPQPSPKPKSKHRPTPAAQNSSDSSEDEGLSLKELEERRQKAKKQAAKERRTSKLPRAEDAVATKWEKKQKSTSKDPHGDLPSRLSKKASRLVERSGSSSSSESSSKKRSAGPVLKRPRLSSEVRTVNYFRGRASLTRIFLAHALPAVKKVATKAPRFPQSDSDEDARPIKRPLLTKSNSTPIVGSSSSTSASSIQRPAINGKASTAALAIRPSPAAKPLPASLPLKVVPPAVNKDAIRAIKFKRKPPALPPTRASALQNGLPSVSTAPNTAMGTPGAAGPSAIARADRAHSTAGSPAPPARAAHNVRFADDADEKPAVEGPDAPPAITNGPSVEDRVDHGPAIAERIAAEAAKAFANAAAERARMTQSLEERLVNTEYYRSKPVFQEKALPAACAEAVMMTHGTALRMKGRGVAIICNGRETDMAGEGVALGLLMMLVGARTPNQLSEVAVVCLHRRDSLEQLERMYCDLVNMSSHHVEFLHFGGGLPVQPILLCNFLIMPSFNALQQSAALDRFCRNQHEANVKNCTVLAHPASIVRARSRLPNWNKVVYSLAANSVPIAEKTELTLGSAFVTVDKSVYLAPGMPSPPFPDVTIDSELNEIETLLCWKRTQEPAKWRRFIVVVDQVDPVEAERAKDRGIELYTWIGLDDLIKTSVF